MSMMSFDPSLDSGNEDDPMSQAYDGITANNTQMAVTGNFLTTSGNSPSVSNIFGSSNLAGTSNTLFSNPMLWAVGAGLVIAVMMAASGD